VGHRASRCAKNRIASFTLLTKEEGRELYALAKREAGAA